jgi:methylated-DNA-protein-cysteine methyltransferase related protein
VPYFRRKMFGLEIPPGIQDAFFQAVWKIVRMVPSGKVATYGQIAGYTPNPEGVLPEDYLANRARWVGHAMAASPGDVPWQRVINAQGKISTRQGAREQRKLLEAEGVVFDSHDRIDFSRFGWQGPGSEWLRENGMNVPDEPQQLSLL